jgi:hypothetical protein
MLRWIPEPEDYGRGGGCVLVHLRLLDQPSPAQMVAHTEVVLFLGVMEARIMLLQ